MSLVGIDEVLCCHCGEPEHYPIRCPAGMAWDAKEADYRARGVCSSCENARVLHDTKGRPYVCVGCDSDEAVLDLWAKRAKALELIGSLSADLAEQERKTHRQRRRVKCANERTGKLAIEHAELHLQHTRVTVERNGLLAAVIEAVVASEHLAYVEAGKFGPGALETAKARKQVSDLELRSLARNLKTD